MTGLVDGNNFFVSCERVVNPSLAGRAVAVLSNNDGCCVARSNEFKALGIPMGTPYFKLRDREKSGEIVFRSSNYELYADFSRRIASILRESSPRVEQYSIDEAFIEPPCGDSELEKYGAELRAKILKWTGIPCGVGFAATKTLAKIANHAAKKTGGGVFVLRGDPSEVLGKLPVEEVWGIGRRLAAKFRSLGIFTALELRDMPDESIRAAGSVSALRTAMELRGIPSTTERGEDADPESLTCSRTFGEYVTSAEALAESLAYFASSAAERLRTRGMTAAGCNAYAQIGTAERHTWVQRTVMFPRPTNATNEILSALRKDSAALFCEGASYRKSGVVFFGLEREGTPAQGDLFETGTRPRGRNTALYKAVDAINARFGKSTVSSAAAGIPGKSAWRMKRSKLSPRATTRWDELLVAR